MGLRRIAFRGKSIDTNEWLYGDLVHSSDMKRCGILVNDKSSYDECEVNPCTVGQFTGLKDENGKEIFEGDILDFNGLTVEVRLVRGVFTFLVNGELDEELCRDCRTDLFAKVIGNVYENLDILKGGEK